MAYYPLERARYRGQRMRARMRLGQLESLPVLSQNNLPLQSTGTGQALKQLMLLKFIWRASKVFIWLFLGQSSGWVAILLSKVVKCNIDSYK